MRRKNVGFKIALMGATATGKSTFVNYLVSRDISTNYTSTIGVEYNQKIFSVNNSTVIAHIWDTTGQQAFSVMVNEYKKSANVVLVFFDATNHDSYEAAKALANPIQEDCTYILIGTHYDKNNVVISAEDVRQYIEEEGCPFESFFDLKISRACQEELIYKVANINQKLVALMSPKVERLKKQTFARISQFFNEQKEALYGHSFGSSSQRAQTAKEVSDLFAGMMAEHKYNIEAMKNLASNLVQKKNATLQDHYDHRMFPVTNSRLAAAIDNVLNSMVVESLLSEDDLNNIKNQHPEPQTTHVFS